MDETLQGVFLLWCARVLWLLGFVETSDVADSDGVRVVVQAVSPHLFDGPAIVDAAVKVYHEVITDAAESTLLVPPVDVLDGEVTAFDGGTAVDDDFVDRSHF